MKDIKELRKHLDIELNDLYQFRGSLCLKLEHDPDLVRQVDDLITISKAIGKIKQEIEDYDMAVMFGRV